MTFVFSKQKDISIILKKIDNYSNEILNFIDNRGESLSNRYTLQEIWLSIYLFAMLKLTEKDFRNKSYGQSIKLLNQTLDFYHTNYHIA